MAQHRARNPRCALVIGIVIRSLRRPEERDAASRRPRPRGAEIGTGRSAAACGMRKFLPDLNTFRSPWFRGVNKGPNSRSRLDWPGAAHL